MNTIDSSGMSRLLDQLRAQAALAQGVPVETQSQASSTDFASLLKQTLDKVNETQQSAENLAVAFENGDTQTSLEEVMIAKQKANIAFQATMQVRNKLVSAYQEVMSMSV